MKRLGLYLLALCISCSDCVGDDLQLVKVPSPNGSPMLSYETWTQMSFVIKNSSEADREVLVTTFFEARPDQQYSRRLWIPANSVRSSWSLAKTPQGVAGTQTPVAFPLQTLVLERQGTTETAVATDQGRRQHDHLNRLSFEASRLLLMRAPEDEQIVPFVDAVHQKGPQIEYFHDIVQGPIPETVEAYDGFSHVILATSRIESNLPALDALREWVSHGGRLWIHLERTGAGLLSSLLTESAQVSVIEDVDLNSYEIDIRKDGPLSPDGVVFTSETPVHMLRTISQDCDVLARIDGWPAVLLASQGEGMIVITTIEPQAFFYKQDRADIVSKLKPRPTRVGESLGGHFFYVDRDNQPSEPDWPQIATAYIGHRIPGKWLIGGLLSLFCLVLVLASLWAGRSREYFPLVTRLPAVAVVTAGLLSFIGAASRGGISPVSANIQVIEADKQGNISILGAESTYSQQADSEVISVHEDGEFEFVGELPGAAKRFVWNDDGTRTLENVPLTAGIHTVSYRFQRRIGPANALLTFNEQGIVGELGKLAPEDESSGLLLMPGGGRSLIHIDRDGQLESGSEDVLRPGQSMKSNLVSDRQRLQMSLYEEWLTGPRGLPDRPQFYFWRDPVEVQAGEIVKGRYIGDALVAVPVEFQHPPADSRIYLPSPMVQYKSWVHPEWGNSTVFNNRTRQWSPSTASESYTALNCTIPPELFPLEMKKLVVTIELRTPNRDVRIFADRKDGTSQEVALFHSPIGQRSVVIEDAGLLSSTPESILKLLIHVGRLAETEGVASDAIEMANEAISGWKIQSIDIEGWAVSQ